MRKTIILSFLILLSVFQALAQEKKFDESLLSKKGKEAYQTLSNIDLFALGGIGYGGVISPGQKALFVLIEEKAATSAFKNLVKTATPEGGLYALLGLKMLNCNCFAQELGNFRNLPDLEARKSNFLEIAKGNVWIMQGCLGFQESRLKVAKDIELETVEMKWLINSKRKNKRDKQ